MSALREKLQNISEEAKEAQRLERELKRDAEMRQARADADKIVEHILSKIEDKLAEAALEGKTQYSVFTAEGYSGVSQMMEAQVINRLQQWALEHGLKPRLQHYGGYPGESSPYDSLIFSWEDYD